MGALPLEVVVKFKGVSVMDVSTKARNQTNPISVGTDITFKDKMGFGTQRKSMGPKENCWNAFYITGDVIFKSSLSFKAVQFLSTVLQHGK